MSDIKLSLSEKDNKYMLTYTMEKKDLVDTGRMSEIVRQIERKVVEILANKIENDIYNEIFSKIDAAAIANATTVRIIQSMADQNGNRNNY